MPKGQWTAPESGDAPKEVKDILASAYAAYRDKHPAEDPEVKETGAKIAWAAVKKAGWHKNEKGEWIKAVKDKAEHSEVEIDAFKAGKYPQGEFTEKELAEIAETYDPKVHEAPIRIGHDSDYKGATQIPAFGWIGKVKVVGDHLKLVASQFSDQLKAWYKEGLYKKVSAAFYPPNHADNPTPGKWYLHHLAFLGATPPAVKGLEGIAFSQAASGIIEFAEMDAEVVELAASKDTYEAIEESFATCLARVQDAIASDSDNEAKRTQMTAELSECFKEIQGEIGLHFAFLEKAEEIQKSETSEIKRKLKEFANKIFNKNKQKEASDMDAQKEKEYTDKIAALEVQVKEFNEAKAKAEADAKAAEKKAADDKLKAEIKDFCEKNGLATKQMDDLHLQEALFSVATSTGVLEFGENKTSTLDVVKNVLSGLKPVAKPPEGEVTEFNKQPNSDLRPEVFKRAEKYVKDHPGAKEFSDCRTESDKINRVISLNAQGKLRF